jgi:hypothetical protein
MKKILVVYLFLILACSKPPAIDLKYDTGIGQIIAKESCSGDSLNEYWVIDLYHQANTFKNGDSLFVNGIQYSNVVKGIVYNPSAVITFKIGQKVGFDFEKKLPIQNTRTCSTSNPILYPVKQIIIKEGLLHELRGG